MTALFFISLVPSMQLVVVFVSVFQNECVTSQCSPRLVRMVIVLCLLYLIHFCYKMLLFLCALFIATLQERLSQSTDLYWIPAFVNRD